MCHVHELRPLRRHRRVRVVQLGLRAANLCQRGRLHERVRDKRCLLLKLRGHQRHRGLRGNGRMRLVPRHKFVYIRHGALVLSDVQ